MPNILIICTANICRSPMAMVLLSEKIRENELPGQWTVESAGTWAREGYPASKYGGELMSERGLDLANHRSRMVTKEMLDQSSLVLTMESGQKEALAAEFPDAAHKIFMLSEMIGFKSEIRDPYGGPKHEYEETAEELQAYIEEGFEKIIRLARA